MEVNVNIDSEQVNKMVADAILQSTIGNAIKASIDRQMTTIVRTWDNPLDAVIMAEIKKLVIDVFLKNHQEQIRSRVTELVANSITNEFVTKVVESGLTGR